jgi:hypothetical protein
MGTLKYGQYSEINCNDRLLAHLQIVIGAKLRRSESFYLSWVNDHDADRGRTTIWLHPSISLKYKYYVNQMPRINPTWIEELAVSANSLAGLYVGDEPAPAARTKTAPAKLSNSFSNAQNQTKVTTSLP